jgi:hypothetical protein
VSERRILQHQHQYHTRHTTTATPLHCWRTRRTLRVARKNDALRNLPQEAVADEKFAKPNWLLSNTTPNRCVLLKSAATSTKSLSVNLTGNANRTSRRIDIPEARKFEPVRSKYARSSPTRLPCGNYASQVCFRQPFLSTQETGVVDWLVLLLVGSTCLNNRTTGAVDKVEQIGACPILFTTRSRSATRLQYRTTTSINTCDSTGCCPILDYYCCYFYYYYHLLLDPLNNIHEHCEERE